MQFSKIAILSLVALVTAMPNAEPVPEPHQIEARTFWNLWGKDKGCECRCDTYDGGHKRDVIDARTPLFFKFPTLNKWKCDNECKKKCDDYYDEQEKYCEKDASDKFGKCCEGCRYKDHHKRTDSYIPCEKQCKIDYKDAKNWCDKRWGH